jgi:uncharacterized protein
MSKIIINGSVGRLEGSYHSCQENSPSCIILHSHPKCGGAMNNKIIYELYCTFIELGFNTLRFNFRGVGNSEGYFDNGDGELSDASSALDWIQSVNPSSSKVLIVGFSFGAWIGMQLLMRRPEISNFITISPPVNIYDFNFLSPCPISGKVIHGTSDSVVDLNSVTKLVMKLNSQRGIFVDYGKVTGADHFFTNQFDKLKDEIKKYVNQNFTNILSKQIA